jgi:hypothetical protein
MYLDCMYSNRKNIQNPHPIHSLSVVIVTLKFDLLKHITTGMVLTKYYFG